MPQVNFGVNAFASTQDMYSSNSIRGEMTYEEVARKHGMAPLNNFQSYMEYIDRLVQDTPPIVQRAAESTSTTTYKSLFSAGFSDPLDLIDELLSMYITTQTEAADKLSKEIEAKSKAIADINSLWGEIMVAALGNVSDADSKDGFGPGKKGRVTLSKTTLDEIDAIIKQVSGEEDNISVITNTSNTNNVTATYDQLQEMNARMTAYCDKIQVDLDTQQQEFKNMMTEISSAQEELRDVRRAVVSMSQQG